MKLKDKRIPKVFNILHHILTVRGSALKDRRDLNTDISIPVKLRYIRNVVLSIWYISSPVVKM